MSVEMDIVYEGGLHCRIKHLPSGAEIVTDAPKDNGGKGEAFSPTDLAAAALGTCIMTIMGLIAERMDIDLTGTRIHIVKEMAVKPTRRIEKIGLKITFPKGLTLDGTQKKKLERTVEMCPVGQSLHPDVKHEVEFIY